MSSIGSVSSNWLNPYINAVVGQSGVNGIGGVASGNGSGGSSNSAVSGAGEHHHHRGGGKLMQDVTQALQSMGLNIPAGNGTAAVSGTSPVAGTSTGTSGANSTSTIASDGTSTSSPSNNIAQALYSFMGALQQALNAQQQSSATGGGSSSPLSGSSLPGVQNGYNTVSSNLQGLISSLQSNGNGSGGNSTLQTDFNNLVGAIGNAETSATSAGTTPASSPTTSTAATATSQTQTLQNFLTQLENNISKNSALQYGKGSIFSQNA